MKASHIIFLLASFCHWNAGNAYAQIARTEYCKCRAASKPLDGFNLYGDSLYSTYDADSSGITVSIYNTTKDTLYIFNSYIQNQIAGSKYIHRVDTKNRVYKVSFLPLVPYVFTTYSDVITADPVIGHQQVVYDFFKLPPNSQQDIRLSYSDLFKNRNYKNNVMKDFDVKKLHKYTKKLPQKFYTTTGLKGKYKLQLEFAVYKSVNLLCNQSAYYMQEFDFDQQAKDFKILAVPITVQHYNYTLLQ